MFIRSERLFLRPGWPEDWHDVLARIADEGVVMNLASAPWPYTAQDAQAFVSRPQERLLPHFVITLPGCDGADLIGCAGLLRGDSGAVELGYWIARDHWGQGYATEAARAVLGLARALGHGRVLAHHFADNPASGRVLAKAGFRPTGTTGLRTSLARRGKAPAISHAIMLDVPNDGGDDGAGGAGEGAAMRAA